MKNSLKVLTVLSLATMLFSGCLERIQEEASNLKNDVTKAYNNVQKEVTKIETKVVDTKNKVEETLADVKSAKEALNNVLK